MRALGSFVVAHTRLANRDPADAGHDLAFRKMAVAHEALLARLGLEIAMLCENSATSASTAWVSSARAPLRSKARVPGYSDAPPSMATSAPVM